MSTVIALVGRAGSGKSTVARMIQKADPTFRSGSFAAPLKALAVDLFDLDPAAVYGPSHLRATKVRGSDTPDYWDHVRALASVHTDRILDLFKGCGASVTHVRLSLAFVLNRLELEGTEGGRGLSHRRVLQVLGTDFGRVLWPDVWVRAFLDSVGPQDNVVVDDCRFVNEARAVYGLPHGYVVFLSANGRLGPLPPDAHPSEPVLESFLESFNGVLHGYLNTDHLDYVLERRVVALVDKLRPRVR